MNLRVISKPAQDVQTAPVLTALEAVAVARKLAPKFAERAAHAEKFAGFLKNPLKNSMPAACSGSCNPNALVALN